MIVISNQEFNVLSQYIYNYCGINLSNKKMLIEGRLNSLLTEKGFMDFSSYLTYMLNDASGDAVSAIVDRISTNHTFFMREVQHFNYFRDHVLPEIQFSVKNKDLRIWSAGCSSGEEPYTLAMIIADYFADEKVNWDTRILATDISSKILEKAREGVYKDEEIISIPIQWKLSYFKKTSLDSNMVAEKIKREVLFRKFNLMEKIYPFRNKFHVIFCRNVMLYFDECTKRDLVNRFYEYTEPGGYLFIGQSETLNRDESDYQYIMPAVYRKG
ncbi:MAG: chemotaxis protein CheR [Syntrophomonadaceae bacterium]|nr:chemotaxis protein CheR [Syntrophomonadaceae bacterium]